MKKAEKKPEPFTRSDFHALLRKAAQSPTNSTMPSEEEFDQHADEVVKMMVENLNRNLAKKRAIPSR